jgi:predicted ATPase
LEPDGNTCRHLETKVTAPFIRSIRLSGLLSFPPDMEAFELRPLNVLIGPNGSGKSNLIEAFELVRAMPSDFAGAIRDGGGPAEWLWKGQSPQKPAVLDFVLQDGSPTGRPLRHVLEFTTSQSRADIVDEAIEECSPVGAHQDVFFYYRFQRGRPVINTRSDEDGSKSRELRRDSIQPDQSVLAQRRDPDLYPELTWVGSAYGKTEIFREWTFGRYTPLRQPQPADLPEHRLLPDSRNLALLLNQIEHKDGRRYNQLLKRFLPQFERMTTLVSGGTVQFYLHETGLSAPIPATRLSDGTLRFVALLAILLAPKPPPLVCIEEPELGLHPDVMELLAELFVEASQRMQLIVTTHSDALVSALTGQPDAIVACERIGAGTSLRRLDPDRLKHWLDDYRLGDLWRIGELGANP